MQDDVYVSEVCEPELSLAMPYATSRIIEAALVPQQKLRVYRAAPAGIELQIRTRTGKQGRITRCGLSRDQARAIGERLLRFAETGQ